MAQKKLSREVRRKQILGAAFEVFAQKGFSRATTEEIATKAGISQGLIFKHYKTKKELFLACLNEHTEFLTRSLGEILAQGQSSKPEEMVQKIFSFFFSYLAQKPSYIRMMLKVPGEIGDPEVKDFLSENLRVAKELSVRAIQKEIKNGVFRDDFNVELFSWLFVGSYISIALLLELGVIPNSESISISDFLQPFLRQKSETK